jgi:hypothetical protein
MGIFCNFFNRDDRVAAINHSLLDLFRHIFSCIMRSSDRTGLMECWNDGILIFRPRGIEFQRCLIILGHQIFIITYDFLNQRLMISGSGSA